MSSVYQGLEGYYIEGANKFRIVSDQLGTPRVVFNIGTGAVIAKFNHDEFGVTKANTNTTLKLPFGFAGGLMDWDTGLIRFGARDYDPALGRWLSKDPILFEGGDANLYGYVMNDPVNWIDPEGTRRNTNHNNYRRDRRPWWQRPPPPPEPPPRAPGVPKDQGPIDPPDLYKDICRRFPDTCRPPFGAPNFPPPPRIPLPFQPPPPKNTCTPGNLSGR